MYSSPDPQRDRHFEETLRDGIMAVRNGQRRLAQSLLNRAIILNGRDARPYVWLSATTDDPHEQREYLERAVALEPGNSAARHGLSVLLGKVPAAKAAAEQATCAAPPQNGGAPLEQPEQPAEVFLCPQCGGHLTFDPQDSHLTCVYCGYERRVASPDVQSASLQERVLDFVMPTARGHRWAEGQQRLACGRCGAVSLLAPGTKSVECPYCGSAQLLSSSAQSELIDPQMILLMKVNEAQAQLQVRNWLGRGLLAPDDLRLEVRHLHLRPAYYSFWVFDGTLELPWSCEVKEGSGKYAHWKPVNGVEMELFSQVWAPGVKSLTLAELAGIEPFDLQAGQPFTPDALAGWTAMVYDRSLSDASLLARERVIRRMRREMHARVQLGREKRNLELGGGRWSGLTFQHVLAPLWIGTYHYGGKEYHLLVNGQTGKVGGEKPRDTVKLGLLVLIVTGLLVLVSWLLVHYGLRYSNDFFSALLNTLSTC